MAAAEYRPAVAGMDEAVRSPRMAGDAEIAVLGDVATLATSHLGLAHYIAGQFYRVQDETEIDFEEFQSEALLALTEACASWDARSPLGCWAGTKIRWALSDLTRKEKERHKREPGMGAAVPSLVNGPRALRTPHRRTGCRELRQAEGRMVLTSLFSRGLESGEVRTSGARALCAVARYGTVRAAGKAIEMQSTKVWRQCQQAAGALRRVAEESDR